jgi:hypothetical protein
VTKLVLGNFADKLRDEIRQLAILVSERFFQSVKDNVLSLTVPQVPLNNIHPELQLVVAALQQLIDSNYD